MTSRAAVAGLAVAAAVLAPPLLRAARPAAAPTPIPAYDEETWQDLMELPGSEALAADLLAEAPADDEAAPGSLDPAGPGSATIADPLPPTRASATAAAAGPTASR